MQSLVDNATIYNDFQGLAELKLASRKDSSSNNRAVAEQFEALFIQSMLKSMRDASLGDSLTGSDQTKLYQDMMDKQLSLNMSKAGGIGIADVIERQLNYKEKPRLENSNIQDSLHNRPLNFANNLWGQRGESEKNISEKTEQTIYSQSHKAAPSNWDNPKNYIEYLTPYVKHAAEKLNTSPDLLLAISALETGWGKHISQTGNGKSSFNLFGIKATDTQNEDHVYANTLEYNEGNSFKSREPFRVYADPQESIDDFANFILQNPRYSDALKLSEKPESFIREIQKAGYATDPKYADKVIAVMQTLHSVKKDKPAIINNLL